MDGEGMTSVDFRMVVLEGNDTRFEKTWSVLKSTGNGTFIGSIDHLVG